MPTVILLDSPCRVRPMLDAIGAQEALEACFERRLPVYAGSSRELVWEKERLGYARRRNAAERKLEPHEHRAWVHWRSADAAGRAAIYAMLTDLPEPQDRGRPGAPAEAE